MEPKKCEDVLVEIERYKFSQEEQTTLKEIKILIDEYDFDEALELIGKINL